MRPDKTTKMGSVGSVGLLSFSILLAALAMVPSASAHDCDGEDPATQCGPCTGLDDHNHDYNDGRDYCDSDGCELTDVQCILSRIING